MAKDRFTEGFEAIEQDMAALGERNKRRVEMVQGYTEKQIEGSFKAAEGQLTGNEKMQRDGEFIVKESDRLLAKLQESEKILGRPAAHTKEMFQKVTPPETDRPGQAMDKFVSETQMLARGYQDKDEPNAKLRGIEPRVFPKPKLMDISSPQETARVRPNQAALAAKRLSAQTAGLFPGRAHPQYRPTGATSRR